MKIIKVLSDTHGFLKEELKEALKESDLIIHAGDIGSKEVLDELKKIAKVHAVKGNMDVGKWTFDLPKIDAFQFEDKYFYLLHNIYDLDLDPESKFDFVITGHTHKPLIEEKEGVIYLNPGSSGPKRFCGGSESIAQIKLENGGAECKILNLDYS